MAEQYPFYTIGIPVYNRANFIKRAVQSVLNQDFTDFELIIVDNKSTDGTWEYLCSINDLRIRIFQNEKNIGMIPNFRRCIEEAKGEWFKFLMSDDYLLPDALSYLSNIITKEGEKATYLSRGIFTIDQISQKGNLSNIKKEYTVIAHQTKDILNERKKFKYGSIPAMPNAYTLLTSDLKAMLQSNEYLNVESRYGQSGHCVDYFIFYFNAKKHEKIVEISKPLYIARIHETNAHKKYIDNFEFHIKGDIFMNEQIFSYHQKLDSYLLKHMLLTFTNKNREKKSLNFLLKTSSEFIKVVNEVRS